jgi:uncharacterized surface protein with fasciclin (FAS1) repeats
MKRFSVLAVLALLLIVSVGVFAQDDLTLAGAVEDESDFSILFSALEATDLLDTLADEDAEFTLFAPSDEAFEELLEELEIDEEELLSDTETLSAILLYHVVEGTILSDDFEDDSEIETLNGASIAVTVNDDDEIILDEFATVTEADIEVLNGVIHVIDGVLIPATEAAAAAEACFVFTEEEGTVQVRVGPGENRTSIAFLPANVEFEVLGQATDAEGDVWFKLDKEEATPGRSNAEAWVSADAVETIGDCENVVDVNAPAVVPITSGGNSTGSTSGSGGGGDTSNTGTPPNAGSYTVSLAQFVNASCAGFQNVVIPSADVWSNTVFTVNISNVSSSSLRFDGNTLTNSGGQYRGQISRDGYFVTIIVIPVNATYFVGQLIYSYNIQSGGRTYSCSDTTDFSATHN